MLRGGSRIVYTIKHTFPWLDLYYTDHAQHIKTEG